MNIQVIASKSKITLINDSDVLEMTSDNKSFKEIYAFVTNTEDVTQDDWNRISKLNSVVDYIKTCSDSRFTVKSRCIYYDGMKIPSELSNRLLYCIENELDCTALYNFTSKLYKNPNKNSISQAFRFIASNRLPILKNGDVLAYKMVNSKFKDLRTNSMDNSPGCYVKEDRDKVVFDPTVTCARGLHVCSKEYLGALSYKTIVICQINPRDICSVPIDYNNSKIRVCGYKVIEVYDPMNHDKYMDDYIIPIKDENKIIDKSKKIINRWTDKEMHFLKHLVLANRDKSAKRVYEMYQKKYSHRSYSAVKKKISKIRK